MTHSLPFALALSLILTLVLELGFYLLTGKRDKKDLMLVALVNIVTNPAVVLTYWLASAYTAADRNILKATLEALAVLIEWYYYRRYSVDIRRPLLFSITANAFSYSTGVFIQLII